MPTFNVVAGTHHEACKMIKSSSHPARSIAQSTRRASPSRTVTPRCMNRFLAHVAPSLKKGRHYRSAVDEQSLFERQGVSRVLRNHETRTVSRDDKPSLDENARVVKEQCKHVLAHVMIRPFRTKTKRGSNFKGTIMTYKEVLSSSSRPVFQEQARKPQTPPRQPQADPQESSACCNELARPLETQNSTGYVLSGKIS